MDLHQLENILAIYEEKSITRAAEKRFITQSALNQQLQKLETELGTALFVRSRSNWQPTPAGRVYLDAARQMLDLRRSAYSRIGDLAEQQRRRITVGLIPERGVDMFTAVYPAFHKAYPQVSVEPVECNVRTTQKMISAGQMDLGLATLATPQRDDNLYHLMAEEEIFLAVPAGHPLAAAGSPTRDAAPEISLSAFAAQPFVRIYQRSTLYDLEQPLFEAAGFTPRVLFSTSSNVSMYRIVEAGLACALLPAIYAKPSPHIVYFRLPQRPTWQITMCSRQGAYLSAAERYYLQLCREYWTARLPAAGEVL